ncbi:hypothetical protein SALBM311S_04533 [Streptomyces alboniger]
MQGPGVPGGGRLVPVQSGQEGEPAAPARRWSAAHVDRAAGRYDAGDALVAVGAQSLGVGGAQVQPPGALTDVGQGGERHPGVQGVAPAVVGRGVVERGVHAQGDVTVRPGAGISSWTTTRSARETKIRRDQVPCASVQAEVHKKYTGENRFPLILQNIHRYFFYAAIPVAGILTDDTVLAFRDERYDWGHMGLGTLVFVVNIVLIWAYTLSCHSCRHIVGGKLKHFSLHPARYRMWQFAGSSTPGTCCSPGRHWRAWRSPTSTSIWRGRA